MHLPKHMHTITGFVLIVLVSALAFAANVDKADQLYQCVTQEQVTRAMERSLSGVSLTCNEAIRQDNLAKLHTEQ